MPKNYEAYKFDQPVRKSNSFQCSWELSRVEFHRFKCWKGHPTFEMKVFCISRHNSVPDTQALPNTNILAFLIFCFGNRTVWVQIVLFLPVLSIYLRRKWEGSIKHQMAIEQTLWWAHVSVSKCCSLCLLWVSDCLSVTSNLLVCTGISRSLGLLVFFCPALQAVFVSALIKVNIPFCLSHFPDC